MPRRTKSKEMRHRWLGTRWSSLNSGWLVLTVQESIAGKAIDVRLIQPLLRWKAMCHDPDTSRVGILDVGSLATIGSIAELKPQSWAYRALPIVGAVTYRHTAVTRVLTPKQCSAIGIIVGIATGSCLGRVVPVRGAVRVLRAFPRL